MASSKTKTGPETRTREVVEQELGNATASRDQLVRSLRETRGELEAARREEAAGFAEAAAAGKKLTSGKSVTELERKAGELERQVQPVNHAVQYLEAERDELDLAELQDEARRAGEVALETLEKSRRAAEENRIATARAEQLREQVHQMRVSLRRPRANPQTSAASSDMDKKWSPRVKGLNG